MTFQNYDMVEFFSEQNNEKEKFRQTGICMDERRNIISL